MPKHRGHKGYGAGPHNQNGNGNNRNNNNNNNNNNNRNGNGNHRNRNRNKNSNNNSGYNNGNGNGNNSSRNRNRNNNNRNGNGGHGGNNGSNGKNGNSTFGHPLSQLFSGYFQQRQNQSSNNRQHQQGAQRPQHGGGLCRYNPCTRGNCQRAHAPGQQANFQGGGGPVQNQQRQQVGNGGDASLLAKLTLCRHNPCTKANCHRVHAPGQRATVQGGGHPGQGIQQNMFPSGGRQQPSGASGLLRMFQQLQQHQHQQQPFFVDYDGDVIMCECGGHPEDPSFCCRDQYELLCASNPSLERSGKALTAFSASLYDEMGLVQEKPAPGQGMGPEDVMRMLGELLALGGGPRRKGRRGGCVQAGPFANPGFLQDMIS